MKKIITPIILCALLLGLVITPIGFAIGDFYFKTDDSAIVSGGNIIIDDYAEFV